MEGMSEAVVIELSVSGETEQIVQMAGEFKKNGCSLISITNKGASTLPKFSDYNLSYYVTDYDMGNHINITTQIIGLLISIVVSFVLGAVLTMIVGFEDEATGNFEKIGDDNTTDNDTYNETNANADAVTEFVAPITGNVIAVTGNVIPVNQVKDEAIASEAMGKGVGIEPENGKVYMEVGKTRKL